MDHELSGVLVGLTLATRPEEIWRCLIEATAFGATRSSRRSRPPGYASTS